MFNNNDGYNYTIPPCLAPGHYLVRHELIALHCKQPPPLSLYPPPLSLSPSPPPPTNQPLRKKKKKKKNTN
jgi:hypothetical protein